MLLEPSDELVVVRGFAMRHELSGVLPCRVPELIRAISRSLVDDFCDHDRLEALYA